MSSGSGTAGVGSCNTSRGPQRLSTVLVLLLLAVPLISIRLGFGDYGNYPEDPTVRRAYDMSPRDSIRGPTGRFRDGQGETASDPEALDASPPHVGGHRARGVRVAPPITDRLPRHRVPPERPPGRGDHRRW